MQLHPGNFIDLWRELLLNFSGVRLFFGNGLDILSVEFDGFVDIVMVLEFCGSVFVDSYSGSIKFD